MLKLTQQPSAVPLVKEPAVQSALTHTILTVRYSHLPTKFKLLLGDKVLLDQAMSPEGLIEAELELPLSKDGLELQLQVEWPPATPATAVTVELAPDEKDPVSQTRWSNAASMNEILVYEWN
jgi:hypothetical protein